MAKKAKAVTRRGKAKTAYELLERVCEAIKAHPLNYYQGYWKSRRGRSKGQVRHTQVMEALPPSLDVPENTCGTAFCRAGFIVAEHDGYEARPIDFNQRARRLLGIDEYESFDDVSRLFDASAVTGTPGTSRYVRQGIAGLRAFMKEHEAHLKARSLKGV